MLTNLIEIFCLLALAIAANGLENSYLKERPDFLRACKSNDPDLNDCFRGNIQALIDNYSNGIPGLRSFGQLDPLRLEKMHLERPKMKIDAKNLEIRGLSKLKVLQARVNLKDFSVKLRISLPKVKIDSEFKVKGKILLIPLRYSGKGSIDAGNMILNIDIKSKLRNAFGTKFADIQSVKVTNRAIDSFRLSMGKVLNGYVNKNWRQFYEETRPSVEKEVSTIVLQRLKRLFDYIPASYIIADI